MDVIFEAPNGRELKVELWYFDTVLEMKKKIEKYHKIPVSCQTLIFNGQVMKDDLDTEFYEVFLNCRIQLQILYPPPQAPQPQSDHDHQHDDQDHHHHHHRPAASITKATKQSAVSSSSSKSRMTSTKIHQESSSVVASSSSTIMTPRRTPTTKTQPQPRPQPRLHQDAHKRALSSLLEARSTKFKKIKESSSSLASKSASSKTIRMRSTIQLQIKVNDGLEKEFRLSTGLGDTVGQLKSRIQEIVGISVSEFAITLRSGNEVMTDDHRKLGDYGLTASPWTVNLFHEMNVNIKPATAVLTRSSSSTNNASSTTVMKRPYNRHPKY